MGHTALILGDQLMADNPALDGAQRVGAHRCVVRAEDLLEAVAAIGVHTLLLSAWTRS